MEKLTGEKLETGMTFTLESKKIFRIFVKKKCLNKRHQSLGVTVKWDSICHSNLNIILLLLN